LDIGDGASVQVGFDDSNKAFAMPLVLTNRLKKFKCRLTDAERELLFCK